MDQLRSGIPWRHYAAVLLAIVVFVFLAALPKAGETQELIDILMTEQSRMERYSELDFAQKELMHHQASTILATYGGYNSFKTGEAGSNAMGTDLMRLRNRLGGYWPQSLATFKRKNARDEFQPQDEASMAEKSAALMGQLLAAGEEIADLCEADKAYEASLVYRDKSMPLAAEITRLLYTLNSEASSRFKKEALKAKYK